MLGQWLENNLRSFVSNNECRLKVSHMFISMLLLAIERPPKLDYWSISVVPVAVSIRFSIAGLRNKLYD